MLMLRLAACSLQLEIKGTRACDSGQQLSRDDVATDDEKEVKQDRPVRTCVVKRAVTSAQSAKRAVITQIPYVSECDIGIPSTIAIPTERLSRQITASSLLANPTATSNFYPHLETPQHLNKKSSIASYNKVLPSE